MKPILFTEAELETIEAAMEDYQHYADPDTPASDLIGGLPIMDRYNSIMEKLLLPIATYDKHSTHRTPRGHNPLR